MAEATPLIRAAGAVLWRGRPPLVAVVHRPRYDDWSLPKGKVDPGERLVETALREVTEETGSRGTLGRPLGTIRYDTTLGPKQVDWWTMRGRRHGGALAPDVDEVRWLEPAAAAGLLTHDWDREVLDRALSLPLSLTTVLLLRHASAGSRSGWPRSDASRPLDEVGQAQALALSRVLSAWGPQRVVSAPLTRCRATVAPLARDRGLDLETAGWLADDRATADVREAVDRLRAVATSGRTTVLCSQGDAIPAMLAELCRVDGVRPASARLPSRKGSLWVLSLRRGVLLDAVYVAEPTLEVPVMPTAS